MKYLAWMGNGGADDEGAPGVEQQVSCSYLTAMQCLVFCRVTFLNPVLFCLWL